MEANGKIGLGENFTHGDVDCAQPPAAIFSIVRRVDARLIMARQLSGFRSKRIAKYLNG